MDNKITKCIIMSRVSTTIQELDIQEEECIKMALSDGYAIENMILIPRVGESARKVGQIITVDTPRGPMEIELDRDGIWDMKKRIENDPDIDCVYIWEVSRLARRMDVLTPLLKYFADKQVQLRVKTNGISYLNPDKTVNPASKMTIEILGEVAEQEMNVKIERFKRSKKVMAEQGRYAGGKIPYGYSVDKEHGGIFVINEDEAKYIREIFDLYESGISQPCIAREYYRRGIVELNLSKVNNIITNEQYTGRWMKQGWSSYERSYPVIISPEQYDHCRAIAKSNNTFASKARSIYYAQHLIICSCGRFWYSGPSKVVYSCAESHRTGNEFEVHTKQCHNKLTISINILDSILWKVAQSAEVNYIMKAASDDIQRYHERLSILNDKLGFIDARLAEQDEQDKRINTLYKMGRINTTEELMEEISKVREARKAILQEESAYIKEQEHLKKLIVNIETKFDLYNINETEDQLRKFLEFGKQIENISDDKERFDIIHRHIKAVHIENSAIEYEFGIVGRKLAKTRFITIEMFNGDIKYFHFIPFDGGKNTVLEANPDGTPVAAFKYEYLPRFFDEGKRKRQAEDKQRRKQNLAEKFPEDKYIISFNKLKDFLGVERKMAYKLVEKGFLQGTKVLINKHNVAFDKSKCIELIKDNAGTDKWARKILDFIKTAGFDDSVTC